MLELSSIENHRNNEDSKGNMIELLKERLISLIKLKSEYSVNELNELFPNKKIVTADFFVTEKDDWEGKKFGYEKNNIINIDHHTDEERMLQYISSTNLAIDYVIENGAFEDENIIVTINHTDCDRILSSLILRDVIKIVDAEGNVIKEDVEKFGKVAIVADHTGKENKVADLLQSLDDKRDVALSLRNLQLLLEGNELEEEAKQLLDKRLTEKSKAKELIEQDKFSFTKNNIAFIELEEKISGELITGLLPESPIIIIGVRRSDDSEKWNIKIRLGLNKPEGFVINFTYYEEDDTKFPGGGRWNAGATKRMGGVSLNPEQYAERAEKILQEFLEKK